MTPPHVRTKTLLYRGKGVWNFPLDSSAFRRQDVKGRALPLQTTTTTPTYYSHCMYLMHRVTTVKQVILARSTNLCFDGRHAHRSRSVHKTPLICNPFRFFFFSRGRSRCRAYKGGGGSAPGDRRPRRGRPWRHASGSGGRCGAGRTPDAVRASKGASVGSDTDDRPHGRWDR